MSVWLDGIGLESVDSTIKIKSVLIGATDTSEITSSNAKYSGVRYLGKMEGTRAIKVSFKILAGDPSKRESILNDVLDWARGTRFEVASRPNQYINVRCTDYPSLEWVRDYASKDITITFTAYDPDFKAVEPTIVNVTTTAGVEATATVIPPGTQDIAFLEAEIKNNGATTMNTATLSVGGRSFVFAALGLAAGKTLVIARDIDCRLAMTIEDVSVLDKRTAASDDDLILIQREANTVSITTANACAVKLSARGQYR